MSCAGVDRGGAIRVIVIKLLVDASVRVVLGAAVYKPTADNAPKTPSAKIKGNMAQEVSLELRKVYPNLYSRNGFIEIISKIPDNLMDKSVVGKLRNELKVAAPVQAGVATSTTSIEVEPTEEEWNKLITDDVIEQLRLTLRAFKNLLGVIRKQEFDYLSKNIVLDYKGITEVDLGKINKAISLLSTANLDVDDLANRDYVVLFNLLFPLFIAGIIITNDAQKKLLFASFWIYSDTSQESVDFNTRFGELSQKFSGYTLHVIVVSHRKERRKVFEKLEITDGVTYSFNMFTYDQLTFDITEHCLAPINLRKLAGDEVVNVKSDFKSLPSLFTQDATAKVWGLTNDTVLEVHVPNLIKASGTRSTLLTNQSLIISRVKKSE